MAFDDPEAGLGKAVCLDPHDLVVSKLVAGRNEDYKFAQALLAAGLARADVLSARAELIPGPQAIRRRVLKWIEGTASRL